MKIPYIKTIKTYGHTEYYWVILFTCKQLETAKIHLNTSLLLSLTAIMPIIQVTPITGKRTVAATNKPLIKKRIVSLSTLALNGRK